MPSTLRVRPRIRQAHSSRSKTRWAAAGNQSRPTNGGVPSGPGIGSNLANRQRVFRLIKPHLSAAGKLDLPTRTPPRLFDQSRPHALGPQLGNLVLQLIAWELKLLAKDSHRPDEPPLRTQAARNSTIPAPHPPIQIPAARSRICDPPSGPCSSWPDARQRSSLFLLSCLNSWLLELAASLPGSRASQCQTASARNRLARLLPAAVALSPLAAKLPLQG